MADPYTKYGNYVPFEKMTKVDNKPEWLVVHCSDSDNDNFNSIQRYHITDPSRMYENFAYHYCIERGGARRFGRPVTYHASAVSQDNINSKAVHIVLCGKFETHGPDAAQVDELRRLLKELRVKFPNIPRENIVPHRHWAKKTCYGSFLSDDWAANLVKEEPKKPEPVPTVPAKELEECKTEVKKYKSFLETLFDLIKSFLKK